MKLSQLFIVILMFGYSGVGVSDWEDAVITQLTLNGDGSIGNEIEINVRKSPVKAIASQELFNYCVEKFGTELKVKSMADLYKKVLDNYCTPDAFSSKVSARLCAKECPSWASFRMNRCFVAPKTVRVTYKINKLEKNRIVKCELE